MARRRNTLLVSLVCILILKTCCCFPDDDYNDSCYFKLENFKNLVTKCGEATSGGGIEHFSTQLQRIEQISLDIGEETSHINNCVKSADLDSIKNAMNEISSREFVELKQKIEEVSASSKNSLTSVTGTLAAAVGEMKAFSREMNEKISAMTAEIESFSAAVGQVKADLSRFSRAVNQKFSDVENKLEDFKGQKNVATTAIVQNNQAPYIQCPSSNLNLIKLANGKRYYFSRRTRSSWYDAKDFCEKNQMHLASPKTQTELSYLHGKAAEIEKVSWWLSASDVGQTGGDFKWHDGTKLSRNSQLWDRQYNQPNDFGQGSETCVNIFTGFTAKLLDSLCTVINCFICEAPAPCL